MDLAELHERARPPAHWTDDPRSFSDYGDVPGDFDFDLDDEEHLDDEHAHRFRNLLQEDQERTPRETWRRWRAHSKRNPGVEHPEQTADRLERHHAAEAARTARIDRSTAGRVQNRFDPRTASNVAQNGSQSRRLNASHADQPPAFMRAEFDFTGESFDGGPFRSGRPAGQRSRHSDYAWQMRDGW